MNRDIYRLEITQTQAHTTMPYTSQILTRGLANKLVPTPPKIEVPTPSWRIVKIELAEENSHVTADDESSQNYDQKKLEIINNNEYVRRHRLAELRERYNLFIRLKNEKRKGKQRGEERSMEEFPECPNAMSLEELEQALAKLESKHKRFASFSSYSDSSESQSGLKKRKRSNLSNEMMNEIQSKQLENITG